MSKKALRRDEIGYWSEVKLDLVREYASAYSMILSSETFIEVTGKIPLEYKTDGDIRKGLVYKRVPHET